MSGRAGPVQSDQGRPARAVALLALALAAVAAPALVLTGVLFIAMCGQWLYAVRGWLRTPEGIDQVEAADRPPTVAGQ